MRRPKLYLETSVWSHLFADDAPKQRADTEALFEEIEAGQYEIYISELVTTELDRTPDPDLRDKFQNALNRYAPEELVLEEDVLELAKRYIDTGVIPSSARDDAVHVAAASVEELDVLVSLNMRHIVRARTRREIGGINLFEGFRNIDIATPEEVLGYGKT